jgi:hypothetical protein
MRRRFASCLTTALWSGLVLIVATGMSQADTANFAFHIQDRPGYPPNARIKITLKTAGAVNGSTIAIGATTLTIGVDPPTTLANGDSLTVAAVTGDPNSALILYEPLSRVSPADLCHYLGGMNGDESVSGTFTGPTVTGYRITSYSAAGSIGILPADCSKASRRVKTFDAQWTTPPPGLNLGREPLDVVLVLDKSGSMSDPPPSDPVIETKWNVLTESVKQFVALWQLTDTAVSDDRIGLMFYSDAPSPADFGGGSFFQSRGTNLTSCNAANYCEAGHHNWCQVMCKVGATGPGGSTAMGPGLRNAITAWKADHKNDPSILLMTDGIQNVAPCIVPDGQSGCSLIVAGSDRDWKFDGDADPIFKQGIPVATVSMGLASGPPQDVLDGIAKENAGISLKTSSSSTSAAAFADTLVSILKGNTLSLLSRTTGTMPSSSTTSAPTPVLLDGSVKRAVIMLGWQGHGNEGALDLVIQNPGGTTVVPVKREDGTFFTAQAVDLPGSGPTGNWSVQVIRRPPPVINQLVPSDIPIVRPVEWTGGPSAPSPNEASPIFQPPSVPYQLSVYSAESRLEYRLNATRSTVGTGDALTLEVEISYDGKPLTGLGSGLTVHIDRPNKALGTVLHNSDVPDSALSTEPSPGDDTSQYERKALFLSKNSGLAGSVEPQPIPTTYALSDNGNSANGDVKKDDGIYTAKITDTSMPGLYKLTVTLDWDLALTGKIHRVETLQREVKVNVDSAKSIVAVSKAADPGKWLIKVEPVDKFGNYLGPGFPNSFKVQVNGGGSVSGIPDDPRQLGAYNITLVGVPAGVDPVVSISVDGHEIRNCKLTALGNCSGSQLGKFAVFADLGVAIPHGTLGNVVNTGVAFNAGLEYILKPNFSVEGILGVHHFPGKIAGDTTAIQFTGGGKFYFMPGPNRPFVRAGLGGYHFTSGTTNFGGYFGGGWLHEFNAHFGVEGVYTFHAVNTPGTAAKFSTIQGGVRYVF